MLKSQSAALAVLTILAACGPDMDLSSEPSVPYEAQYANAVPSEGTFTPASLDIRAFTDAQETTEVQFTFTLRDDQQRHLEGGVAVSVSGHIAACMKDAWPCPTGALPPAGLMGVFPFVPHEGLGCDTPMPEALGENRGMNVLAGFDRCVIRSKGPGQTDARFSIRRETPGPAFWVKFVPDHITLAYGDPEDQPVAEGRNVAVFVGER